jgi:hypothetical protein
MTLAGGPIAVNQACFFLECFALQMWRIFGVQTPLPVQKARISTNSHLGAFGEAFSELSRIRNGLDPSWFSEIRVYVECVKEGARVGPGRGMARKLAKSNFPGVATANFGFMREETPQMTRKAGRNASFQPRS